EIILGIRPEDLHDEPVFIEGSPNSIVNASIEVSENLVHEALLYLTGLGKDNVIARVDGRSGLREGQNVKLAVDMNKVHVFDKDTEENVLEHEYEISAYREPLGFIAGRFFFLRIVRNSRCVVGLFSIRWKEEFWKKELYDG